MPRRTRSQRLLAAANNVKAPVISEKMSKSECAQDKVLSSAKEPDVSEEQDNPVGDVAPGADGDVCDAGDEADADADVGDVADDVGGDTGENATAGTLQSDDDDHSELEDALFEPLVLDMEEDDDESPNEQEDSADGANEAGEAGTKGSEGDEAVGTTEDTEQKDTDEGNQEEADENLQDDAECDEEQDDADEAGEEEPAEGDESVEVHEEEAEEGEQAEEEAEYVEEVGEVGEDGEEDDGDQDGGAESELQHDGGLSAESKMAPGAGEDHPVDVGGSGCGENSNHLPLEPGDCAEDAGVDAAGEDVPMDSRCAGDEHSNLEADDELVTNEYAEEPIGEDAGDAEVKEELVDEEAAFLVEDIRDLCPSVPVSPAESIPVSLKESIERSVKIFIEKLLEDHRGGSASASHDDLALQQDAASTGKKAYGCTLCNVHIGQPDLFDCHTSTMRHTKRLRWMYFMGMNKELRQFHCRVCHISMPCREHLVGHVRSDRHVCLSKALNVHPKYSEYLLLQHYPRAQVQNLMAATGAAQMPSEKGKTNSSGQDRQTGDKWKEPGASDASSHGSRHDASKESKRSTGRESRDWPRNHYSQEQDGKVPSQSFVYHCELCQVVVQHDNQLQEHYKGKKHRSRLQEQQRKVGKVAAEEAPPAVENEEPKPEGGEQMVEGAEAVDSPENGEAEPGRDASSDDRGDAAEEGVSPSASAENREEGHHGDHSRQQREKSSKESSAKGESRSRDGKEASSRDKGKDSKDNKDRAVEKDKGRSSSASEKHGGGGKDVSSRDHGLTGSRRKPHLDTRKESGRRMESRKERELPRRDTRPPVRDFKRKGSPEGTSSSSKRGKFHCYTCKVVIYSEKEYRDHFNSKTHRLEVVHREEKVLRHRGRSPPPFVCPPRRRSRSPTPEGRWRREREPSPRVFADPGMLVSQHQQPFVGSSLQEPQRVADVFSSLQQQQAVLENYTERRGAGGGAATAPVVAATLENMILLQQRLLSMAATANVTASPLAAQQGLGLQQGIHQAVQPVGLHQDALQHSLAPGLQHDYRTVLPHQQQQQPQQHSYRQPTSTDYSQPPQQQQQQMRSSHQASTAVPNLQQSLQHLRQSQQYNVASGYQQPPSVTPSHQHLESSVGRGVDRSARGVGSAGAYRSDAMDVHSYFTNKKPDLKKPYMGYSSQPYQQPGGSSSLDPRSNLRSSNLRSNLVSSSMMKRY